MRIKLIGFTKRGIALARNLAARLVAAGDEAQAFGSPRHAAAMGAEPIASLDAWVADAFAHADAIVFVSASGIACRAIAPHLADKYRDPAVVVTDELGQMVIPLASGHVGGASDLARRIAALTRGRAFVSTATDLSHCFAVDAWAASQSLAIVERDLAKEVSCALIEGEPVGFASDWEVAGTLPKGLTKDTTARLGILVSLDATRTVWPATLHLVPRVAYLGIGCKRSVAEAQIATLADEVLTHAHISREALVAVHTIDVKAKEQGLVAFCANRDLPLATFTADQLRAVAGRFAHSDFVEQTVGVGNVCERSASATGATLICPKVARGGVTCAVATDAVALCFPKQAPTPKKTGSVTCVGIGPAGGATMTAEARVALLAADVIVGYTTYVNLIRDEFPEKAYLTSGMRGEVERVRLALEAAQEGACVALVCSGDAGVYGMAGLAFELAEGTGVEVTVVAGVTAATAAAALLGAPLANDWCSVSLSDLMASWDDIERRLEAAAAAGFVICLYNPGSKGRPNHLRRACTVLMRHLAPDTWCGHAHDVGRPETSWATCTLAELADIYVDMTTIAIVGNSQTTLIEGRLVTERGYKTGGRI